MNLTGVTVVHKQFGEGIVSCHDERYVVVSFPQEGDRKFAYPDAFSQFLSIPDLIISTLVNVDLAAARKKAKAFINKQKEELARIDSRLQVIDDKRRKLRTAKERTSKKEMPMSANMAFKCILKTGENKKGVDVIHNYVDAKDMSHEWRGYVGVYKSGAKAGESKPIRSHCENGLCLLTTCLTGEPEENRIIFAAFLMNRLQTDDFQGSAYVEAKDLYKLPLTIEEAIHMPFWRYFESKPRSKGYQWGIGLNRYIDYPIAQRILQDLASLKEHTTYEKIANNMLSFYQAIHSQKMITK